MGSIISQSIILYISVISLKKLKDYVHKISGHLWIYFSQLKGSMAKKNIWKSYLIGQVPKLQMS